MFYLKFKKRVMKKINKLGHLKTVIISKIQKLIFILI